MEAIQRNQNLIDNTVNPPRLCIPHRLNAEKCQRLRDIVTLRPHLRRAPDAEADHLWIGRFLFEIPRERLPRELLADLPCGRGR